MTARQAKWIYQPRSARRCGSGSSSTLMPWLKIDEHTA